MNGNSTSSLSVERPTIWRSEPPPHYLGGSSTSGTYTAQSLIYSDPKGAPEIPQFILSEGPESGYGALSCTNCWYPTYTALKPSTECLRYNVTIRASYEGFESEPLWIFNNAPASLEEFGWHDFAVQPYGYGWETHRRYKVLNMCNEVMDWLEVNEWFTNHMAVWTGWTNWSLSWTPGVWDGKIPNMSTPLPGKFNFWAEFDDIMFEVNVSPPVKVPQALPTGSNGRSENPASTVTCHQQFFKAGTTSTSNGVTVKGPFKQYHYLDHGDHKSGACLP